MNMEQLSANKTRSNHDITMLYGLSPTLAKSLATPEMIQAFARVAVSLSTIFWTVKQIVEYLAQRNVRIAMTQELWS